MKTSLALVSLLALSAGLHANETPTKVAHAAKIVNIEAKIQRTPDFEANGLEAKKFRPREWVEIEAEVEVKTSNPTGYIPALQAEWSAVVMKDNPNRKVKGQPKAFPYKLSGVSEFKNIRTKDGKVFLSAYIEPHTLTQFFGDGRINLRDFTGFALKLTGDDLMPQNDKRPGVMMSTVKGGEKFLEEWKYDYSDEGIVAKSKSPFAMMWIDRYPAEKAGG